MQNGHLVYISLGSNIAPRAEYLERCLDLITQRVGNILGQSSIYETEPWGVEYKGNAYLNMAIELKTFLPPHILLYTLLGIEASLDRIRQEKYGDRTIDLDIIYYGQSIIKTSQLIVPHPLLQARNFVLQPLDELAPDFIHPVLGKSNRELFTTTQDKSLVRLY